MADQIILLNSGEIIQKAPLRKYITIPIAFLVLNSLGFRL